MTLAGGEEQQITVQFMPVTAGEAVGLIELGEEGQPPIEVTLRGIGLAVPDCAPA